MAQFATEPMAEPASVEQELPLLSVVSGNPTDEELAALTAVVSALTSASQKQDNSALALWQRQLNRGQRLGERLRPGPGSWRRARPM